MTLRKRKDKQGTLLIVGSFAAIALLGVAAIIMTPPPACPPDPSRKTVILLDHTEAIATQTAAEISARALAWVRDSVKTGEMVTVFAVNGTSNSDLKPLFESCKLRENVNRFKENAAAAKKNYQENFVAPLERALAMPPSPSDRSPIAQALIDVSLSTSLRSDSSSLVVFSDLLENDRGFSVYTCGTSNMVVGQFRRARTGAQERPLFRNTRVKLHAIPRQGISPEQLKCRDALWAWFFGDSQGTGASLDIQYLPGGAVQATSVGGSR